MRHYDWRRPRTQQEQRANSDPEQRAFSIQSRGKRSLRMLVTAWNDISRKATQVGRRTANNNTR